MPKGPAWGPFCDDMDELRGMRQYIWRSHKQHNRFLLRISLAHFAKTTVYARYSFLKYNNT
jgi:hypothetical protein